MRHLKAGRKLGMTSTHRMAMFRNMVTSLIEHERIQTTDTRAKELRRIAEKMITLGKKGDLHAMRQAMKVIREKRVAKKLFDDVAPRFKDINGGYTRIIKVKNRVGDNAQMSLIELTVAGQQENKKARKDVKKKAAEKKEKAKA